MDEGERVDATGRCLKKAGVVTFRQVSVADHFRRVHQVFAVPHDLLFLGLLFSSFVIVSRAGPFFVPLVCRVCSLSAFHCLADIIFTHGCPKCGQGNPILDHSTT
jgi:hypothetical protein